MFFNGGSDFSDTVQTGSNEFESVALDLSVKAARRLSPLSWYNPSSSSSEYDSENSMSLSIGKSPSLQNSVSSLSSGKSPSLDDPDENLEESPLLQNSVSSLSSGKSPSLHDPDENLEESPLLQNSVSSLNKESPLLDNNNQESTLFDVSDKNAGESTLFEDTNVIVKTEPCDLQVEQETTPVKRPSSVSVKRPVKRKLNRVTVWANKRVKLTSMPTLAKKLKEYNKLQKNLEKKRRKWKKTKQLERKKKTDDGKYTLKNFSIKLDKVDIDSELNKLKNRKAKPVNLEEQDPLLNSATPDEVDSILAEDRKKTNGSSKVSEVNLKTSDGSMTVQKYAIRIREKKPRDFLCPALNCDKVCHMVKELNGHIASTHPDFKYRCSMCPKTYSTYNARYKHEHTHYQLPYSCHFCRKRFLFPGLRDRHEGQHTGKNLFPCTWRSCKVKLSSKDALRQHVETHTEVRYPCPHKECEQTFNTISILKQHEKGSHGDGYISLCGSSFDWSDGRNEHQNECTDCAQRKEEKLHLPKNLKPLKQWKKSVVKNNSTPYHWMKEPTDYCAAEAYLFYHFRCVFPFV